MYRSFYGLKEKPFSLLPDPAFLYLSRQHDMAMTLLEYGLENQAGFCVITGKAGTGKTTLLRQLLNQIGNDMSVGLITNTHHSFGELLRWILHAYGLDDSGGSCARMHQVFVEYLIAQYAKNRRTVLIVDEAQNMSVAALEELRMLSNINSEKDLLLQVILVGQPPLRDILRHPELEQFAQRVAVDYHLDALGSEETRAYIRHRILVAGGEHELFTDDACEAVYRHSGGIPRLINLLCDLALVYGYGGQAALINEELIGQIVREREQSGALPVFVAAAESRTANNLSLNDACLSMAAGTSAVAAAPGRRAAAAWHASEAMCVAAMEKKNITSRAKPDDAVKERMHAVKTAPAWDRQNPVVIAEPETPEAGLIAAAPAPAPPAMFDSSHENRRTATPSSSTLPVPFTYGSARRAAVSRPARTGRYFSVTVLVAVLSAVTLGWYFLDRTGLTAVIFDKPPPPVRLATTPDRGLKPTDTAPVTPPVANASTKQEAVAASPDSGQEKNVVEEVKLKQIQREPDVALVVADAAKLERESLRMAVMTHQRSLTAQHEATLTHERESLRMAVKAHQRALTAQHEATAARERANQLARVAELAISQAQTAEKAIETKAAKLVPPLPETPKRGVAATAP